MREAGFDEGRVEIAKPDGTTVSIVSGTHGPSFGIGWILGKVVEGWLNCFAVKALEREVRELRRENEILRKASAWFAQAELDRPLKR